MSHVVLPEQERWVESLDHPRGGSPLYYCCHVQPAVHQIHSDEIVIRPEIWLYWVANGPPSDAVVATSAMIWSRVYASETPERLRERLQNAPGRRDTVFVETHFAVPPDHPEHSKAMLAGKPPCCFLGHRPCRELMPYWLYGPHLRDDSSPTHFPWTSAVARELFARTSFDDVDQGDDFASALVRCHVGALETLGGKK